MDRTYRQLLLEGAERATYRKRPVDTSKEIEKIKQKIKADKLAGKDVKIKAMEKITPTGQAITEAKRKSGRKALKEQVDIFETQQKLRDLQDKGASQKDIELFYAKQLKIQKMEKDLMLLRDEPEKYLAKLQEINQLKQDQNVQKELLEQIKSQGLALTQLTNLYSGMMTPAQLLESTPAFKDLTSAEKKVALGNLQKQVPRDKAKQKVVIQQIISQPKEVVDKLKEGVRLETKLQESLKPIKAKAEEVEERPKKKKGYYDVLAIEPDYKQMAKDKILNMITQSKFDSGEQKDFVLGNIDNYLDELSEAQLEKLSGKMIKQFIFANKKQYDDIKPKSTDILFKEADDDEDEADVEGQNIARAIDKAEDKEVEEQAIHPELAPLLPAVSEHLQEQDNLDPDVANIDAIDALQGVSADIESEGMKQQIEELMELGLTREEAVKSIQSYEQTKSFKKAEETELPESEPEEEELAKEEALTKKAQELSRTAIEQAMEELESEEFKLPTKTEIERLTRQELLPLIQRYNYTEKDTVPEMKKFLKQRKEEQTRKENELKQQQIEQERQRKKEEKEGKKKKGKGKGFEQASGEGFFSDIRDKIGSWAFKHLHPLGRLHSYIQKGKGFVPLHKIPPHIIAGSLAHHIKRVRNKRKLMNVHIHNPFENTENEEYRKKLTKGAIDDVRGGNLFGSFLAGITEPFRLVSKVVPGPWSVVAKAADALNVPTVGQVISS